MIIEIRKHMHGAWILAVGMGLSFAIGPVINFVRLLRMRTNAVAIVNGDPIVPSKVHEATAAYDAYYRNFKMLGLEKFIKKLSAQEVLESCIADVLKGAMAKKLAIEVHDKELAFRLAKEIGQRYVADGVFDKERYSAEVLASTGMKMSQYEVKIREQMAQEALEDVFSMSSPEIFVPVRESLAKKFAIVTLDSKAISSELESAGIAQSDLVEFYNAHSKNYLSSEERVFETLLLKEELFKDSVLVSEDEALEYYQASVATSFTKPARYAIDVWEASIDGFSDIEAAQITDKMVDLHKALVDSGSIDRSQKALKGIEAYSKGPDEATKMGIDPVLASAIMDLKTVGATTSVLKNDKKSFFARISEYIEPSVVPFEEAKNEILPILEKRALSTLAREEVEDLIKEARENENGSILLEQEAAKFKLKTHKIESTGEKDKDNSDFKNSSEVQPGLIGCIAKENGFLVYSLVTFKPREVLPFEDVIAEVKRDFLKHSARNKTEALALEIKQSILAGTEYDSILKQWKGRQANTEWVEPGAKIDGLEAFESSKAHKMVQVGTEVLVAPSTGSVKIITLAETRPGKKEDKETEKELAADVLSFNAKRDSKFNDGAMASNQRTAQIKYFDKNSAPVVDVVDF